MLNLNFKCAGSPSPGFFECINLYDDIHNVTENETCNHAPAKTDQCDVSFQHYYGDQQKHTVVVIIWNDVSRQVARTVVNIYKGLCLLFRQHDLVLIFQIFFSHIPFPTVRHCGSHIICAAGCDFSHIWHCLLHPKS